MRLQLHYLIRKYEESEAQLAVWSARGPRYELEKMMTAYRLASYGTAILAIQRGLDDDLRLLEELRDDLEDENMNNADTESSDADTESITDDAHKVCFLPSSCCSYRVSC